MPEQSGRSDSGRPWDLVESAPRHGGYVWLEDRLSELFGQAAHVGGDAALTRWAGEVAGIHRWHSSQWRDRLPELREFPVNELIDDRGHLASTLAEIEAIVAAAGESSDEPDGALVQLHRLYVSTLLDELKLLYQRELSLIGAVGTPMTKRWIELLLQSIELQRRDAENF